MDKRRLIISIIQLSLALAAFFVVSLAWFSMSTEVYTEAIPLSVDSGVIESYELTYYTYEDVYRFNQASENINVYQDGFWNPIDPSEPGIYISEYDPILLVNNAFNNIFIELYIQYNIAETTSISIDLISDIALAPNAPVDAIYLSEVSYTQYLTSSDYSLTPEGVNIFNDLMVDFDLITPISFFDINDIYTGSVDYGQLTLDANFSEVYLYFNISYYEQKVLSVIDNSNLDVNNIGTIIFYQDIKIVVREESLQ